MLGIILWVHTVTQTCREPSLVFPQTIAIHAIKFKLHSISIHTTPCALQLVEAKSRISIGSMTGIFPYQSFCDDGTRGRPGEDLYLSRCVNQNIPEKSHNRWEQLKQETKGQDGMSVGDKQGQDLLVVTLLFLNEFHNLVERTAWSYRMTMLPPTGKLQ